MDYLQRQHAGWAGVKFRSVVEQGQTLSFAYHGVNSSARREVVPILAVATAPLRLRRLCLSREAHSIKEESDLL